MLRPRLLFYAVDGLGLGHVVRLLALARQVRRRSPEAEILFLTSSEASHVIYREGHAVVKVPSRSGAAAGGLRRSSFLRLTQNLAWNAVTAFDPHCVIVDTFAAGTVHELLPLLRWPLRKVFVFRTQKHDAPHDQLLQSTLRLYDLVLVPHAPGAEAVQVPDGVSVVWTGPMLLRHPNEMLPRDRARAALELRPEGRVGLVTFGGGGEQEIAVARDLMQRAIIRSGQAMIWVEAGGPLEARAPTAAGSFRILRDVFPLATYLQAFDAAVAAAGYNSVNELQSARVPTLLWPFERDLDDQPQRAAQLVAAGRALAVGTGTGHDDAGREKRVGELTAGIKALATQSTRDQLAATLNWTIDGTAVAESTNGAEVGADAILGLLQS